jgi:RNA ligase (TIGR02306 family)
MASQLHVTVERLKNVRPHPNAERLDLAEVNGWQTVVGKDKYKDGDLVVYFPPDTLLPEAAIKFFGIETIVHGGRIRQAKLRGEPSFGLVTDLPSSQAARDRACDLLTDGGVHGDSELGRLCDRIMNAMTMTYAEGDDVAEFYGATKYEPPPRVERGQVTDAIPDNPMFPKYTDIENLRNHPHIFESGEPVAVFEKIDGTNSRIAIIGGIGNVEPDIIEFAQNMTLDQFHRGAESYPDRLLAGSMRLARKVPATPADLCINTYWMPWSIPEVRKMMLDLSRYYKQVELYGEAYGGSITGGCKGMKYGFETQTQYRAFDLLIDGHFLSVEELLNTLTKYGVPFAPMLARDLPFEFESVKLLASGTSTLPGANHIKEGVVVRPVIERRDPKLGRVILKYVTDEYLLKKKGDFTDV